MTLVNIKNALLSHFLSASTFNLIDDIEAIKINAKEDGGDFVEHKREIVQYALDELVKLGIIAKVSGDLYVLIQPLSQFPQSVTISPMTALMVSDLINGWTKMTGDQEKTGYVVNKLGITDYDIGSLCTICHALLEQREYDEEEGRDPSRN